MGEANKKDGKEHRMKGVGKKVLCDEKEKK
jgi:hypothetical protein